MASAVPDNGVVLADDWKLVPVDARNWELCQFRRPCDNNGNPKEGEARWFRCGRFYSYGAIGHAMAYVADELMKEKANDKAMELRDAMSEWERIASSMLERQGSIHA